MFGVGVARLAVLKAPPLLATFVETVAISFVQRL
jgi:hypothetical protein